MKRIVLAIFALLLISISVFGQDLDSKKVELEALKKELQAQEKLIQSAKDGQEKSQADLKELERKKKALEKKLDKLKNNETKAKKTLLQTETKIKKKSDELADLNDLCQQEYRKLFEAHYLSQLDPDKKLDGRLLAALLLRTAEEIRTYEDAKDGLIAQKKKQNKNYENLIWSRIVEKKRGKRYSSKMEDLKTDISRLSKSEKKAKSKLESLQKSVQEMNQLITRLQSELTTDDFSFEFSSDKLIWPLKGTVIRDFGEQPTDKYSVSVLNNGIDIVASEGTAVRSVDAGVVAYAQWYKGAGKLVIIDHRNGFFSLYSHNSSLLVTKGDNVIKAQTIALSGSSGSAESPFLHFELRKRGKPVNPILYLE